jgi:hypothetical protein
MNIRRFSEVDTQGIEMRSATVYLTVFRFPPPVTVMDALISRTK